MSRPRGASSAPKQTTRQRKLECSCGCIVRMSRAAMLKYGVPACGCGETFTPADIEDAAALGGQYLHEHPDFAQEMATWGNRAVREARAGQGGADRLRCGGCSAWIAGLTTLCGCGFGNDIQGTTRRNMGGYVAGAASCPEHRAENHIPF